jgi:hypothetical protein
MPTAGDDAYWVLIKFRRDQCSNCTLLITFRKDQLGSKFDLNDGTNNASIMQVEEKHKVGTKVYVGEAHGCPQFPKPVNSMFGIAHSTGKGKRSPYSIISGVIDCMMVSTSACHYLDIL